MRAVLAAVLVAMALFGMGAAAAKPAALGTFHQWDALKDGARKSYLIGGLTLTFIAKKTPKERDDRTEDGITDAVLTVTTSGGKSVRVPFTGGFVYPQADFAVGMIDPANPVPQVVLAAYSGGAHCCMIRTVIAFDRGRWTISHPFGGENWDVLRFPKDEDGDGVGEMILGDDRFAYAFCAFGCSAIPPLVYTLKKGKLVDVSDSGRFDAIFRQERDDDRLWCLKTTDGRNGGCAGFIAASARLGRFRQDWPLVLQRYERGETWRYPAPCTVKIDPATQACPDGKEATLTYPESLAWFLRENGYISRADERWAIAESRK